MEETLGLIYNQADGAEGRGGGHLIDSFGAQRPEEDTVAFLTDADAAEVQRVAREVVGARPFDPESRDASSFELQHGHLLLICAYSPTGHLLASAGLATG